MMKTKSFSDIQDRCWFDALLPDGMHPFARMARWDRPVGVWLLFLPCMMGLLLAPNAADLSVIGFVYYTVLFAVGSIAMRGAGCTINDIWDQHLDAKVERTKNRPLPAGRITEKQAFIFLAAQGLVGLIVLVQLGLFAIGLGLISVPLVIAYPLMKRFTWWPQLFLGFTFNWGILMGWATMEGSLSLPVYVFYIGAVFWTLAYDTIYAFQDIEDDAMVGIKSTARLFGYNAPFWVIGFYAVMGICMAAACMMAGVEFFPFLGMIAVAGAHILLITLTWNPDNQPSSLTTFKRHVPLGIAFVVMLILNIL